MALTLQEKYNKKLGQLANRRRKCHAYSSTLCHTRQKLRVSRQQRDAAAQQVDTLQGNIAMVQQQVTTLQGNLTAAADENKQLHVDLTTLREQVTALSDRNKTLSERMKGATKTLKELATVREENKELRNYARKLELDMASVTKQRDVAKEDLVATSRSWQGLKSSLTHTQKELDEVKANYQEQLKEKFVARMTNEPTV